MGKTLLEMLGQIFGKNIFSKTIGTRTNVIKLPSADKRRLFKNDLDIGRANESQTETIKKELEEIIPDIPKMNDMEKLTLEGNVRRLYNKLFPQETSGEVIDIATKKKVTGEGLESLKEKVGVPEGVEPGSLMDRLNKSIQKLQAQKEAFDQKLKDMPSPLKPSGMDLTTGLTRTASRKILDKLGIKVPDKADPIEVFEKNFGGHILMDVKDVAEEMIELERMGKSLKSMDEILEKSGLFNIKKNPDAPKGMSKEEIKSKDPKLYDLLYGKGDPDDVFATGGRVHAKGGYIAGLGKKAWDIMKPFSSKLSSVNKMEGAIYGSEGIQSLMDILSTYGIGFADGGRVKYGYGTGLKLLSLLKKSGTTLKKAIKEAVDDLIPTGDPKLDADMAVDNMLETYNLDRNAIDQYDILDAYGLAYDRIKQPLLKELKNKPTAFNQKKILDDVDKAYGVTPDMKKELDALAEAGAPKAAERFALKQKYPGIDEKLLTDIIDDTDPNRKAKVLAELDQAMELMKQGKGGDEVVDILKNQSRTKQAEGGLSYLMGF
jgi:hypothetical protein